MVDSGSTSAVKWYGIDRTAAAHHVHEEHATNPFNFKGNLIAFFHSIYL